MKHSEKLSEIKPPLGFLIKLLGSDFSRRVSIHEESSTKFYVYSRMAIWVLEFSNGGYEIRKILTKKRHTQR